MVIIPYKQSKLRITNLWFETVNKTNCCFKDLLCYKKDNRFTSPPKTFIDHRISLKQKDSRFTTQVLDHFKGVPSSCYYLLKYSHKNDTKF
jgi:hypothetical protein